MRLSEMRSAVPPGESGPWKVERFEVTDEEARFESMRACFSFSSRPIRPSAYTRLVRRGHVVMSDTPAELGDLSFFRHRARGDVLINGLGLGMAVQIALARDVRSVTVVEISWDVISLVAPFLEDERLSIVEADAFEWKPPKGRRYDVVWHDVWDDICADNLPQMHCLHRRYGRRCDWQGSWARDLCERRAT